MPFLSVNKLDIDVRITGGRMEIEEIGERLRAFDGSMLSGVRVYKRSFPGLRTPPLNRTYAEALAYWLQGRGHRWSFDDTTNWAFSDRGLPASTNEGSRATSLTPKYGTAHLALDATDIMEWDTGLDTAIGWTLMVWKWDGVSAWEHWALDSDGTKYKDGATTVGSLNFLNVTSGVARLGNASSVQANQYDDFRVYPYVMPSSMIASIEAMTEAPAASLPELEVEGDITPYSSMTCIASDVSLEPVPHHRSGGFESGGLEVSFTLEEA